MVGNITIPLLPRNQQRTRGKSTDQGKLIKSAVRPDGLLPLQSVELLTGQSRLGHSKNSHLTIHYLKGSRKKTSKHSKSKEHRVIDNRQETTEPLHGLIVFPKSVRVSDMTLDHENDINFYFLDSPLSHGKNDPFASTAIPCGMENDFLSRRRESCHEVFRRLLQWRTTTEGENGAASLLATAYASPGAAATAIAGNLVFERTCRGTEYPTTEEYRIAAQAIKWVSEQMQSPKTALSDASLFAVLILAFSPIVNVVDTSATEKPHQACLTDLQLLNVFGTMTPIIEHFMGLITLVKLRGGIHTIKLNGLAQILSSAGIVAATQTLKQPPWPFVPTLQNSIKDGQLNIKNRDQYPPSTYLRNTTKSFWLLWKDDERPHAEALLEALQNLGDYTCVVDLYIRGTALPSTFTGLGDWRNFTQHELMSLVPAESVADEDDNEDVELYEICRLGAITYSLLATFPIPPATAPFRGLADLLLQSLSALNPRDCSRIQRYTLIWSLVIGAMGAAGQPIRTKFVGMLKVLLTHYPLDGPEAFLDILASFLWLPSVHDIDGHRIWIEVTGKEHETPAKRIQVNP